MSFSYCRPMKVRFPMVSVLCCSLSALTPSLEAQRFPGGTSLVAEPPVRFGAAPDASHVSLAPLGAVWRGQWMNQFGRPTTVKALYVNAWAFTGTRLWQIVKLVDGTEINSLVIDVKDDTGCLLYRSQVETARQIG